MADIDWEAANIAAAKMVGYADVVLKDGKAVLPHATFDLRHPVDRLPVIEMLVYRGVSIRRSKDGSLFLYPEWWVQPMLVKTICSIGNMEEVAPLLANAVLAMKGRF